MRGKLISFEGIDGCGKTTQVELFVEYLRAMGHDVVKTKDPGGSDISAKIRTILVEGKPGDLDTKTEYLLFMAARRDLIQKTIAPALDDGKWVVTDRYSDSTYAYQGEAGGMFDDGWATMMGGVDRFIQTIRPNMTFILDVPPTIGIGRANRRGGKETRFEEKGIDYFERVRQAFLCHHGGPNRQYRIVNANQPIMSVHAEVVGLFKEMNL